MCHDTMYVQIVFVRPKQSIATLIRFIEILLQFVRVVYDYEKSVEKTWEYNMMCVFFPNVPTNRSLSTLIWNLFILKHIPNTCPWTISCTRIENLNLLCFWSTHLFENPTKVSYKNLAFELPRCNLFIHSHILLTTCFVLPVENLSNRGLHS